MSGHKAGTSPGIPKPQLSGGHVSAPNLSSWSSLLPGCSKREPSSLPAQEPRRNKHVFVLVSDVLNPTFWFSDALGLKLTNRSRVWKQKFKQISVKFTKLIAQWEKNIFFAIPQGHFFTKLTAIYFSNIPSSESKVWQLARQEQIFIFHFARKKLILLERRQLCFSTGLRFKEEKEKTMKKRETKHKITLHIACSICLGRRPF